MRPEKEILGKKGNKIFLEKKQINAEPIVQREFYLNVHLVLIYFLLTGIFKGLSNGYKGISACPSQDLVVLQYILTPILLKEPQPIQVMLG